jgi:hypothetical protein
LERLGVVFGRLGVAGAILVAAFFLFGVLAGAVVVNRVQTASIGDVREQGEQDQKAEQYEKDGEDKGESKPKHPNNGHSQKPKSPEKSPDND